MSLLGIMITNTLDELTKTKSMVSKRRLPFNKFGKKIIGNVKKLKTPLLKKHFSRTLREVQKYALSF